MPHSGFLILVENPKCYGYVCIIEKFTRQNDDGFNFITEALFVEFKKLLTDCICVRVSEGTIGEQETGYAFLGGKF